jgi:hypothetical protein
LVSLPVNTTNPTAHSVSLNTLPLSKRFVELTGRIFKCRTESEVCERIVERESKEVGIEGCVGRGAGLTGIAGGVINVDAAVPGCTSMEDIDPETGVPGAKAFVGIGIPATFAVCPCPAYTGAGALGGSVPGPGSLAGTPPTLSTYSVFPKLAAGLPGSCSTTVSSFPSKLRAKLPQLPVSFLFNPLFPGLNGSLSSLPLSVTSVPLNWYMLLFASSLST